MEKKKCACDATQYNSGSGGSEASNWKTFNKARAIISFITAPWLPLYYSACLLAFLYVCLLVCQCVSLFLFLFDTPTRIEMSVYTTIVCWSACQFDCLLVYLSLSLFPCSLPLSNNGKKHLHTKQACVYLLLLRPNCVGGCLFSSFSLKQQERQASICRRPPPPHTQIL